MGSVWPVSELSTESVGIRRELVANNFCVHTADATQLHSFVASASPVCIGHNVHQSTAELLRVEDSHYDGFDLEL